ncbi:hypothetical protein GPA27_25000 [Aromatoleum toluolicum]|uniref:Uncharacterized protein n=1 Tax=Aromatoleum toluolicum TaxID=90060 RepID=A0ABX1NMQ2_9RHOO|nr:hypothetical protein [Aromatoleum toluolicum]NMG00643.1 hypothetical protein [Aromatoleum toluolicum]
MKRLALTGICALAAAGFMSTAAMARGPQDKILEFDSMVGVAAPYTGSTNPIRGVSGGGRPWSISTAEGELKFDGKLEIRVTGLVLTETGLNPAATFRAIVSCMSTDVAGNPSTVNVMTAPFPATPTGDSYIEANVGLPEPCIAPIIFVTNPAGAWFAATGM